MNRREFLRRSAAGASLAAIPWSTFSLVAQSLADGKASISEPHFPSRLFLFIWRNWELANSDRMAAVLETTERTVIKLGAMMGLPRKQKLSEDQFRRIYITIIRQNWHVLPHEQLIQLLGWDRPRYEFTLKEDDFLWHKLGASKPKCERLPYAPPSPEETKRAGEIRRALHETFGSSFSTPGEPPFQFVQELSSTQPVRLRPVNPTASRDEVSLAHFRLLLPVDSQQRALAQYWSSWLHATFGTKLPAAQQPVRADQPAIRFTLRPVQLPSPESFEIQSSREGLSILASDLGGFRQAIYHLQDLVEERQAAILPRGTWRRTRALNPRYIYPYFALYGDPLLDPKIDPIPEGYLEKLARKGVNGIWMQAVLRTLAPSTIFPEFGEGWEIRLQNLRRFVHRAAFYGIKIYLYLNEPRTMGREFFQRHPEARGSFDAASADAAQDFALCTSVPIVRDWLRESLTHVFSQVPGLGGIFAITASENLTNCFAHGQPQHCPRCSQRQAWEVVTELLQTFSDGVHKANPSADVIAWDWGWGWVKNGPDPGKTIPNLPPGVQLLSVSEWGKPYTRGGVSLTVGEYSLSVVGPGDRALKHWSLARPGKTPVLAKVQFNNTWEISAVPYVPVPPLVQRHIKGILDQGVTGLMLSWTLGGYPSPNLEVAREYYYRGDDAWPRPPVPGPLPQGKRGEANVLKRVATRRYGAAAAPQILAAWQRFSDAFEEFPYGAVPGYNIPTQHGPANLLRLKPTGYTASMILFPQDDFKRWLGPYSAQTVQAQFEKMAGLWDTGLEHFRKALASVPSGRARLARKDLGIAETCCIHFRSVANQIHFYRLREKLAQDPQKLPSVLKQMKQIAQAEIQLSIRLYHLARQDSTIGYEASNHYYYRPLDFAEKVLNCEHLIRRLETGAA